jgi:hypothetical protein
MSDLTPPRSLSVTVAAILVVTTGCFWLGVGGLAAAWGFHNLDNAVDVRQRLLFALFALVGCTGAVTVIAGFGVLFRRHWGRILAIALAGPWILYGWWFLKPFLSIPASMHPGRFIVEFLLPVVAGLTWLALLIRRKVRSEFMPPASVQIFVKMLDENPPRTRPTRALALGNELFELLPTTDFDPEAERWEFRPGSIVRGLKTHRDGEAYLLATSFGPS